MGKTKLRLDLELKQKINGILVFQSAYNERVLKCFKMDKSHPLSTHIVVQSFDPLKDWFRPIKLDE